MKTWFTITNKADAAAAEIDIFGEIGLWGVTTKEFATSLKSVPIDREITLRIDSPGGSIFDGFAIFNLLNERRDKVTAKVIGVAASMASIVMLAAKRTIAAENATIMIHRPSGGAFGGSEEMRSMADLLDKLQGMLANTYVAKTGKDADEVNAAMDATTWFTAAEAKEWGLVDEVTAPVKAKASFDLTRFGKVPDRIMGADLSPEIKAGITDAIIKRISGGPSASTNQPNAMNKLIKALVDAKLIASADVSEDTAVAQFGAAFATLTDGQADLTNQVTTLKASLTEANDKVAAALRASAESAVASAVKSNRIKDDTTVRAKWVEAFIRDEAGTKAMLDGLPEAKAQRGVPPVNAAKPEGEGKPESTAAVWNKQFNK